MSKVNSAGIQNPKKLLLCPYGFEMKLGISSKVSFWNMIMARESYLNKFLPSILLPIPLSTLTLPLWHLFINTLMRKRPHRGCALSSQDLHLPLAILLTNWIGRRCCAGDIVFQDLYVYDPATKAWTDLSTPVSGTPPIARCYHGFTSLGGSLYVYGGYKYGERRRMGFALCKWFSVQKSDCLQN